MSSRKDLYVCANIDIQKQLAVLIDKLPGIPLSEKFLFANAPVPSEDHYNLFINWLKRYQNGETVPVPSVKVLKPDDYNYEHQLILETYVKVLNLYSWLSLKKPEQFPDHEQCLVIRKKTNQQIEELLNSQKKDK